MGRIDREQVRYVAALARLSLSDEESERAARDLDRILAYAEQLQEVDTSGVEPTSHVIPLPTPMRDDRPLPPIDPEVAVANAPEHEGSAFVVPKVIGAEDEG
jgi:aspartyl-tRNA(Asn)/glutamyl-tRNA(Gln) amidotransferase subunit C